MFFYLLIIFLAVIVLPIRIDKNKAVKKIYMIIIFGLLLLLAGLRSYTVGTDTVHYFNSFIRIINVSWKNFGLLNYEFGFFAFCRIISHFFKDPQYLIFISSLVIVPSIGYFIFKKSPNVAFSIFLYITLNIYFFHLTGMRQSLAVVILLFALEKYQRGRWKSFVLISLLACLFHSSALIFFIIPFIDKIKYTKKTCMVYVFISIILFIVYKPFFNIISSITGKYSGYITSEFGQSNYFGTLIMAAFYFFIYFVCHICLSGTNASKENLLYLKLVGVCAIVQTVAIRMVIFARLVPYFSIYSLVLLPISLVNVKSSKNRLLLGGIIISILMAYWLIIAFYRPEWTGAIPYSFFWN